MANESIKQNYKNIANAIRSKTGENGLIAAEDMPGKIAAIETGITPTGTKSITANGNGIDVTAYAAVDVYVPNPSTGYIDITENGNYDVTEKASAHVNVPVPGIVIYHGTDGEDIRNALATSPHIMDGGVGSSGYGCVEIYKSPYTGHDYLYLSALHIDAHNFEHATWTDSDIANILESAGFNIDGYDLVVYIPAVAKYTALPFSGDMGALITIEFEEEFFDSGEGDEVVARIKELYPYGIEFKDLTGHDILADGSYLGWDEIEIQASSSGGS